MTAFLSCISTSELCKNINKLGYFLSDLQRQPDIVFFLETKLVKGRDILSNSNIRCYAFIYNDSLTLAGGVAM